MNFLFLFHISVAFACQWNNPSQIILLMVAVQRNMNIHFHKLAYRMVTHPLDLYPSLPPLPTHLGDHFVSNRLWLPRLLWVLQHLQENETD